MPPRSDRPFSRRGEAPTAYESALLTQAAREAGGDNVWVLIGSRIGVEALAVVFDELAGEKIMVPTREGFFRALFEPIRNARIIALAECGTPTDVIARENGLSVRRVQMIVRRSRGADASREV
jgi:hypothetical protein